MAKIFAAVIAEYWGVFKTIQFAVIDDHNSISNFSCFAEVNRSHCVTNLTRNSPSLSDQTLVARPNALQEFLAGSLDSPYFNNLISGMVENVVQ